VAERFCGLLTSVDGGHTACGAASELSVRSEGGRG
jgi:hypothetical protein